MHVVTRFAPSPTGFLHIGGARTALFNWLFARHHGGTFRLRIEDTDVARSTEEAKRAIIDGLQWLGLDWDDEIVYQMSRSTRHREVAEELVKMGKAYYCYASQKELATMRETAEKNGQSFRYDRRWRDKSPSDAPSDITPVIRIKAPLDGEILVKDLVQGDVTFSADALDDFIILRSDGTPTYMHAVVVDDHDMGITHIIRGDDHLNNAGRQSIIYQAMGWDIPQFAHIPLIHGPDGAKLSKRHGALGVEAYRDMGYLPEGLRNYLLRLGFAHGDEELIDTERAIEIFDVAGIGQSPSRMDFAKMDSVNAHYLRLMADDKILPLLIPRIETRLQTSLDDTKIAILSKAIAGLKPRVHNFEQMADAALFYVRDIPIPLDAKAVALVTTDNQQLLRAFADNLASLDSWHSSEIELNAKAFAAEKGKKLGEIMQIVRVAIAGSTASPSMFEAMEYLGKQESLDRMLALC